uniref:Mitotic-spindle organizing protein 2B-like n=1 Tax=Ciona intestinalis TaxID=7719 RepID=F6S8H0_CIOIN|nr:mitotic-spindle organizing protein 2B-like [Ciona intestinalis]|eukprot:XP_026695052.1 mitotic-spindle organizing protein 2B-like [Ciona intestinalis]
MSSNASVASSVHRNNILGPEETDLWELCYYGGLTVDPQVFKILLDLLHMDIHPKAVLEVLKEVTSHSKYSKPAAKDPKIIPEKNSDEKLNSVEKKSKPNVEVSKSQPKPRVTSSGESKNVKKVSSKVGARSSASEQRTKKK